MNIPVKSSAKFHLVGPFIWFFLGLAGLYVFAYLLLSLCGQYRPMAMGGLGHWEEYSYWVPAGFRLGPEANRSSPLRLGIMKMFLPLWGADVRWLHNRQDVYATGRLGENGEWAYRTNSWIRDMNGEWVLTNSTPDTAAGK